MLRALIGTRLSALAGKAPLVLITPYSCEWLPCSGAITAVVQALEFQCNAGVKFSDVQSNLHFSDSENGFTVSGEGVSAEVCQGALCQYTQLPQRLEDCCEVGPVPGNFVAINMVSRWVDEVASIFGLAVGQEKKLGWTGLVFVSAANHTEEECRELFSLPLQEFSSWCSGGHSSPVTPAGKVIMPPGHQALTPPLHGGSNWVWAKGNKLVKVLYAEQE